MMEKFYVKKTVDLFILWLRVFDFTSLLLSRQKVTQFSGFNLDN